MSTASKYSKTKIIGRTPTGLVYRGKNTQLGSEVVIKELGEDLRRDAKRRERFFQEARDWAQFSHRNLVKYADLDESRCWIIMEPMQSNCVPLIRSGRLAPARVTEMLRQALGAIGHVHSKGLLHLNVKPTNLLMDAEQVVKVSDGRGVSINRPGILPRPKTHKYIAPELLDDSFGAVGPSSDLYCLGFMFLELLVGPKFDSILKIHGSSESARDVAWSRWHASTKERIPATHDLVPDCPSELAIVIDGLIAKESRQRYQSTDHPLEELLRASTTGSQFSAPLARAEGGHRSQTPIAQLAPVQDQVPRGSLVALPDTNVVFRLLSGRQSGETIGLNSSDIHIGSCEECHVRFDPDDFPQVRNQRIVIRREAAGWQIVPSDGGVMVNDRMIATQAAIRSGDVVRLSWRGPDFQFLLQSPGAPKLTQLAEQYLGISTTNSQAPAPPAPQPAASVDEVPIVAEPLGPAPARPERPATAAADNAPRRLASQPSHAPAAAPLPPGAAVDVAPVNHAVPTKPAAPKRPVASEVQARPSRSKEVFNFSTWSKKAKNMAIAVVGSVVALLVVYAIPTGGAEPTTGNDTPASTRPADQSLPADSANAATMAKN